jgi:hypothetical protein
METRPPGWELGEWLTTYPHKIRHVLRPEEEEVKVRHWAVGPYRPPDIVLLQDQHVSHHADFLVSHSSSRISKAG